MLGSTDPVHVPIVNGTQSILLAKVFRGTDSIHLQIFSGKRRPALEKAVAFGNEDPIRCSAVSDEEETSYDHS